MNSWKDWGEILCLPATHSKAKGWTPCRSGSSLGPKNLRALVTKPQVIAGREQERDSAF